VHISLEVPYDERRLRRTLQFILRPQMRRIRVMGGFLIILGVLIAVPNPPTAEGPNSLVPVAVILAGLFFVFAVGPFSVARAMRYQTVAIRDSAHMTLDDEWVTVAYPLGETRMRWAGVDRVVETPEVWYVMFGKMGAFTVPKDTMTADQRAELAAFIRSGPNRGAPVSRSY
jgi:hypothetical protein